MQTKKCLSKGEMLHHEVDNFIWVCGGGREEVGSSNKNSVEVSEVQKRTKGPTELRQVASGSTTHRLWLTAKKSQVVGVNRSRLP